MTEEQANDLLEKQIRFLECKFVYLAIDKKKFDRLPDNLRVYASNATNDVVTMAAVEMGEDARTPFLFTSEKEFILGSARLQTLERFSKSVFTNIALSPLLFLSRAEDLRLIKATVNYGSEDFFEIASTDLEELNSIALAVKLAKLHRMQIIQTKNAVPVSVEEHGKKLVLGFLEEDLGFRMVAKLAADSPSERYVLEPNKPLEVAQGILDSVYDGIVVNVGDPSEAVVDRELLKKVIFAGEIFKPPALFSKATLKALLTKKK